MQVEPQLHVVPQLQDLPLEDLDLHARHRERVGHGVPETADAAALAEDASAVGPGIVEAGVAGGAAQLTDYDAITKERIPWVVIAITLVTLLVMIVIVRAPLLAALAVLLNLATVGVAFGISSDARASQ